jgi:hypothetical protein
VLCLLAMLNPKLVKQLKNKYYNLRFRADDDSHDLTVRSLLNAERRTQNAERRTRNAERGTPNAERKMQNAECRMQNAKRLNRVSLALSVKH